jgi:hypothetical protein
MSPLVSAEIQRKASDGPSLPNPVTFAQVKKVVSVCHFRADPLSWLERGSATVAQLKRKASVLHRSMSPLVSAEMQRKASDAQNLQKPVTVAQVKKVVSGCHFRAGPLSSLAMGSETVAQLKRQASVLHRSKSPLASKIARKVMWEHRQRAIPPTGAKMDLSILKDRRRNPA